MTVGLSQILEQAKQLAEDISFPTVRQWKHTNPAGKVIGHFQVYFPEEIAHAAGALPFKVMGAGGRIEAKSADARLGSFICSVIRTSLELGLSGGVDFLDAFYTHPICDTARSLAGIWGRNFPVTTEILYLPQNVNSKYSVSYLRNEYARLSAEIERIVQHPITDEDLYRSIAIYNENRRLMRLLYAIKRDTPWLLSASECYVLVKIGGVMAKEEHNALLKEVLTLLPSRGGKKQDKVRVVFDGGFCEQPPLEMLQTIEESCYVVDDDLLIGLRWITDDVVTEGDPLRNLADSYVNHSSYSCVQHDSRKPKEAMLMKRLRDSQAEAVLVTAAKMCEPGLDEQVAYAKELEGQDIPFLVMEFEEKMTAFEQMKMQVETFVESILFD